MSYSPSASKPRRIARLAAVPVATAGVLLLLAVAASLVPAADAPKPPPAGAAPSGADVPKIDKPLVAHWTFDEEFTNDCADGGPHRYDAGPENDRQVNYTRSAGVHGGALHFAGNHALRSPKLRAFPPLEKISLSAWCRPTSISTYNEIFRKEDGDQRVLFSFQLEGTILSMGLNVGGYDECDARIDPKVLLDGRWHHCACTFDGKTMRVYFDGREIGSLARSGKLVTGSAAAGFIASSHGGECLQGGLDDLRIYADALTPQEIGQLHQAGMLALAEAAKTALTLKADMAKILPQVLVEEKTLAASLARTRQNLAQNKIRLVPELAELILTRLQAKFPEEYGRFVASVGDLRQYLTAPGNSFNLKAAQRRMELLLEYRPLNERQWKSQTPEQVRQWKEVDEFAAKYRAMLASGEESQFDPAWLELVVEADRRIVHRPREREAVAPYQTPATPETRDLTAEQAQAALEQDWMHQSHNAPSLQRVKDEIGWTRRQAQKIASASVKAVDYSKELAELDALAAQLDQPVEPVDPKRAQRLYFAVRAVKRRIMFRNPAVNFDKVLFVDMPFPAGSEWPHETRHRLGYMAVPGGRLLVLEGLSPAGHLRQLAPQAPFHGSFWRPDVSFEGDRVLFCFKPHNEKSFHLYEVRADGTNLRQLTEGRFDDLDPIYLPDGKHVAFSTTRGHTYVRCMPPTNAYVLARCDLEGRNMYFISANNEPDYTPSVAHDGRILYTRWEYTDKPLWRAQGLWTVNPDGTQVNTLWGNQTVWPDLLKDARSIPGSRRVMFTGSAHHNWFSGSVAIVDPELGFNFPQGLTKVTADMPYPESGNGPVDPIESPEYHASGAYHAYYSPYPLSERDFIVSANRGGKFVLYLMDVDGNRELIYEGLNNIFHAIPLAARPRPPVIHDRVDWPSAAQKDNPKPGVIYSSNVYYGAPPELRGLARSLRVMTIEHKTYTYWHKRPYASTGPVVSAVQSDGVKRILGTVPIEADGSVCFEAPAGQPLHFQLLDQRGLALQTMRSFANVMPGESRGCLGCHELHSRTPELYQAKPLALTREPSRIQPPPWTDTSVGYQRYVQPVLDKYCGKCHQGEGQARKKFDMTFRGDHLFGEPYLTIIGRPSWGAAYKKPASPPMGFNIANTIMVEGYDQRDPVAYQTPPAMTYLSYRSRLIEIASSGKHHDVKVDPVSLGRLTVWVDAMCPFNGEDEIRAIDDPDFQGVDWLAIRPRIKTAPRIVRPGPIE